MDGTGGYYAKQTQLIRERQLLYGFIHLWNIRNRKEDHRGKEEKLNGKSSEREKNHERLLTLGNELRVAGGEVGVCGGGELGNGH